MSKHTSGLWATRNGRIFPVGKEQSTIASISRDIQDWTLFNEDDARRIVACVNACEGVDTELLEEGELDNPVMKIVKEKSELKQQCDELLAALETSHTVACVLMSRFSSVGMLQEWHQANEMAEKIERAIAKAKSGAA